MSITLVFLIFCIGACIGSFLNVVIYRTWHGDSPYKGRSYCDHCKKQINFYDNIPLVSFLILKGKSRCCKRKIDWTYPVVEGLTGLLFIWWATLGFTFFQLSQFPLIYLQPVFWLIIGMLLMVIFFADILYGIIPDFAVISIGILTVVYRVVLVGLNSMQPIDLVWTLTSGLVAFLLFLILFTATKGRGMGFGDVKYALVMGLLLGFPKILPGIFISFISGALIGILILAFRKKKLGQTIPFGPFLVFGTICALLWGLDIWHWYIQLLSA